MRHRSHSPPPPRGVVDIPRVEDVDPVRRAERERQLAARMAAIELEKADEKKGGAKEKEFDAMAEFAKLMSSRSGGVYMPPARLRVLQAVAGQDRERGVPATCLGNPAQIHHWYRQQGQCGQHQACRARALFREPHQRSWALCAQYHERSGGQLTVYTRFCGPCLDHQYKTTYGRRVVTSQIGQSVPKGIQEERQGASRELFIVL
jgi:hypothetical protein